MEIADLSKVIQLTLVTGYYRCQNCGRDVSHTVRVRRFRLCDECHQLLVPDPGASTKRVEEYWRWIFEMEQKYPVKRSWAVAERVSELRAADAYYPFCECGRRRCLLGIGEAGVFGGPYGKWCPVCAVKQTVAAAFRIAQRVECDRDDEDWLDVLWKSHHDAFEIGVLPDYWFELKLKALTSG